jgi:preprotein translocase subunit SecG
MSVLLGIILVIVCAALAFFVLIQNPKGGGLSGQFGGLGQQMMGVQQSTDTVEKGTWILAGIMAALCLLMVMFGGTSNAGKDASDRSTNALKGASVAAPAAPTPAAPTQAAPTPNQASTPTTAAPAGAQTAAPASNQAAPANQGSVTTTPPAPTTAPAK